MPVTKRGNSWQVQHTFDGKRIRYSFRNERDADIWDKEAALSIAKGIAPVPPVKGKPQVVETQGRTLRDIHRVTHQTRWASLRTTAMTEVGERVVQALGEDMPVSHVTYELMVDWVGKMRSSGRSQATINRHLAALSAMLTMAHDMRWIQDRPKMPYGKERKKERRFLTHEEELLVLAKLENKPEWALAVFAVETGMRLSEIIGLRWKDFGHSSVTVSMSKNEGGRTVPLTKRAKAVIETRRGLDRGPFASMNRHEASRRFRQAVLESGVSPEGLVFHSLRHTCASRLVMAGVDIRRVQAWMGHRTISSTMVYAHLARNSLQDVVAQVEAYTDTQYLVRNDAATCGKICPVVA